MQNILKGTPLGSRFVPTPRSVGAQGSMPDFEELAQGAGFTIPLTEERGITLLQLGAMLAFFEEKFCGPTAWHNRKGEKLDVTVANLYDIVELIVKPATQRKQCSYVELVALGPQVPKWFVSHWWGQHTFELAQCLLQHSNDRMFGEEQVGYWICAFAAVQWTADGDTDWVAPDWVNMYASNQWYDPTNSPFQKAMRLAEGTISIIDSGGGYFKRVWCCYEIWSTLMLAAATNLYGDLLPEGQIEVYKYDIYTCVNENTAVGLTDGFAPADMKRGKHWWTTDKYHREKGFPVKLAHSALTLKLELGEATQEADRKHILNSIVGAGNLDAKPPQEHPRYNQLNNTVRGRFAAAVWRKSLEADQPMNEYARVLTASGLLKFAISFDSCTTFDDMAARALALGFTPAMREIDLDFNGCTALTDDGVEALAGAFPPSMRHLKIDLSHCRFADQGMRALAHYLHTGGLGDDQYKQNYTSADPSEVSFSLESEAWMLVPLLKHEAPPERHSSDVEMETLSLIFAGCGHLSETSILGVIRAVPHKLRKLTLNFYGCIGLGDSCLEALAAAMPQTLTYLELRVARCPDISDAGVEALAKRLPQRLQTLILDFRFCIKLTDACATSIAGYLPATVKDLQTDFVSCEKTTGETEAVLQKVTSGRRDSKLIFWGKDDFSVNM